MSTPATDPQNAPAQRSAGRFAGRTAVITGAGNGIGRAAALRFAGEGAGVVVVGRTAKTLAETVGLITDAGGTGLAVTGDVTSESSMREVAAEAIEQVGPITIVINNAGGGIGSPVGGPISVWHEQIALNLTSAAIVSGAFWQSMIDAGGGVVLNVGSISGRLPVLGIAAYCAGKAGVEMLTMNLALEGAPHRIRCNCVAPGAVLTPTLQEWIDTYDDPDAKAQELAQSSILGRIGAPDDIANAFAFLASEEASWITGSTLLVDGGQSIGRT